MLKGIFSVFCTGKNNFSKCFICAILLLINHIENIERNQVQLWNWCIFAWYFFGSAILFSMEHPEQPPYQWAYVPSRASRVQPHSTSGQLIAPQNSTTKSSRQRALRIITAPSTMPVQTEPFDWSLELNPSNRPHLRQAIIADQVEKIKEGIDAGRINIKTRNSLGKTILHLAAGWGAINIVKLLVESYGVSVCEADSCQYPSLYHALAAFISPTTSSIREGAKNIVFYLISRGACLPEILKSWLIQYRNHLAEHLLADFPLLQAILFDRQIVRLGSYAAYDLQLALTYAAARDQADRIKMLLEAPSLDLDQLIAPVLIAAAQSGSDNVLKLLYDVLQDFEQTQRNRLLKYALNAAQSTGEHYSVRLLLSLQGVETPQALEPRVPHALSDPFYGLL